MTGSVADELVKLGLSPRGVLVRAAKQGIVEKLKCTIPGCPRPRGFDHVGTHPSDRTPTVDHFPILRRDGGTTALSNVRLAHKFCNRTDSDSRVLAKNLIKLFGAADARKVLESVTTGQKRTVTIQKPLEDDPSGKLRLIEALQVELDQRKHT